MVCVVEAVTPRSRRERLGRLGGRDGRCGWSVVERVGKGWYGIVRMVAAPRGRAQDATGVVGRRKGSGRSREGGCTPGIVSNRRVHVHTSIWHIGKAS